MNRGRHVQLFAAIAVSLGTASMGMFSGWPTPVLPKLKNNESSFPVTEDEIGWMLAISPPGFIAGSLATRFISDSLGRRTALIFSTLPMTAGTIFVVTATNAVMLYATKFFWGFSTGMVATVSPIYLAEISDKDLRASLSMVTRFSFNLGMLLVVSLGPFFSFAAINYILLVLPVFFFVACFWIPESPYYLLKVERINGARYGLSRLCGKSGEELETHLKEIQAEVKKDMQKSNSACELFTGKQYRRAFVIAVGLKVAQILTGTVTVRQYLGLIIDEGKMAISLSTALIVFAGIRFLVSFVSSFFVDRVGRVPLLMYSYLSTGITLVIIGIYFYNQSNGYLSESWLRVFSYVTFICIVLTSVIATVGFDSITMVVHAEIFPLNVKDVAMTSLNVLGGGLGTSVTKLYGGLKAVWGLHGVFWCFGLISLAGALFAAVMVPETKGKSLKEIQEILQGEMYHATEANDKTNADLIQKTENIERVDDDCELNELRSK